MRYGSYIEQKLEAFLDKKVEAMEEATKGSSTSCFGLANRLQTGEIHGYKAAYRKEFGWCRSGGWRIGSKDDCYVELYTENMGKEKIFRLRLAIGKAKSNSVDATIDLICKCLDELDGIEQEVINLMPKLEKQDAERKKMQEKKTKIKEMTKKSALMWVKELMKNSGYTYNIDEMDSKIALSVKMKNGTQLEIPINYNRFQKVMPEVMNIIKEVERLLDEKGIKFLIVNEKLKTYWTNQ
jgi:hypothetical protein